MIFQPLGNLVPPDQIYYSKSAPNVNLLDVDYDASKQELLKGQLVFNGIDYSNSE